MIQVTFQFDTLQDLHDFTARQATPLPAAPVLAPAAPEPAEAPAPKARKPKAPPVTAAATPAEPEAEAPTADLDAVRAAIMQVNDQFGLVPARRVLKKFNVARVTELKPEQYAEFVKACGEVK